MNELVVNLEHAHVNRVGAHVITLSSLGEQLRQRALVDSRIIRCALYNIMTQILVRLLTYMSHPGASYVYAWYMFNCTV